MKVEEISVTYRQTILDIQPVHSASDAVSIIRRTYPDGVGYREEMRGYILNRANKLTSYFLVGIGGLTSLTVDTRQIVGVLAKCNAASFILAHNHPSGNATPSHADLNITKRIKQIADLLGVTFIDHIIITDSDYYSLADNGQL
jgi:DNA repair protein RadC